MLILGPHANFWDPVGSFGNPSNDFLQNGLDSVPGVNYCALVRTNYCSRAGFVVASFMSHTH